MKILFVDDMKEIRLILERYLTSWGYETIGAPDGETGWQMIEEHRPDIVITDWVMPKLDGLGLCRRIRSAGFSRYIYLIILTAKKDDVVAGMESGADDFIGKPFNKSELRVRLKAAERIIRLERDLDHANRVLKDKNRRLKESEERLRTMAHFDKLTGLPNRVLFFDRLERAQAESRRDGLSFGLLFIDLDGFKSVNDSHGHETGDELLKGVAERLNNCVRLSDTVARMGGDEFCIILRDVAHRNDLVLVAEKIIQSLKRPFKLFNNNCQIGSSIGIAVFPDDGESTELLISRADTAMYEVKKNGKNAWHQWGDTSGSPVVRPAV